MTSAKPFASEPRNFGKLFQRRRPGRQPGPSSLSLQPPFSLFPLVALSAASILSFAQVSARLLLVAVVLHPELVAPELLLVVADHQTGLQHQTGRQEELYQQALAKVQAVAQHLAAWPAGQLAWPAAVLQAARRSMVRSAHLNCCWQLGWQAQVVESPTAPVLVEIPRLVKNLQVHLVHLDGG